MATRGQPTWITYEAWNTSTQDYQPGDAGNHAIRLLIDGVDAAPANAPAEWAENPGTYKLLLAAAETDANSVAVGGASSTADVRILGKLMTFEAKPDALLDLAAGVEAGLTFRQFLRLAAAVLLGKSSGGGSVYRDTNDTKARVTATVDSGGDRTAVTRDAT